MAISSKVSKTRKGRNGAARVGASDAKVDKFNRLLKKNKQVLRTILSYRGFTSLSVTPKIADCDIVVCFADIRGFTDYCRRLQEKGHDRKIQNFLEKYFQVFAEGLLAWSTDNEIEKKGRTVPEIRDAIKYVPPSMFKNLGDGVMLIWEIPGGLAPIVDGYLTREIMSLLGYIEQSFYVHFRNLSPIEQDGYSNYVLDLEIGFGLARGHAWRLEFPHGIDYAGSVINLASRLQDFARPRGTVAQYLFAPSLFDDHIQKNTGCRCSLKNVRGVPSDIHFWLSEHVDQKQDEITLE